MLQCGKTDCDQAGPVGSVPKEAASNMNTWPGNLSRLAILGNMQNILVEINPNNKTSRYT